MSVPAIVSLEAVKAELAAVAEYATAAGLPLDISTLSGESLRFYIMLQNMDAEQFVVEIDCTDYPMYPPTIEFSNALPTQVERERRQRPANRGLPKLYPSCFHPMPCVCMRYNRKAYVALGGPHNDWRMVDWQLPTAHGIAIATLALIVSDLHSKVATSRGRLGS